MLFARLQRHAVSLVSVAVDGDADDAAGHLPDVGLFGGEVPCVRTAEAHRDAEALRVPDDDIRVEFTRGGELGERHDVGGENDLHLDCMRGRHERVV